MALMSALREEKIRHLEPVVNAREAQRLAEDVRARPLTAERRLPALLELLSIRIGESAGTGLERAVGVKPALHHIELAQPGSKAQIALRAASAEKLGDLDEAEMHRIGHRHAIAIDAVDGGAAVEQGGNRVDCVEADGRLEYDVTLDVDIGARCDQHAGHGV
jgi:hypothetical protein